VVEVQSAVRQIVAADSLSVEEAVVEAPLLTGLVATEAVPAVVAVVA
jgi:hypothetical protein